MAQFAQPVSFNDEAYLRELALKNARLGLLLWRIANGLVFVFFAFANALMRSVQPSWPPPGVERLDATLPVILTGVLLFSSVTASRAMASIRRGDATAMSRHLVFTSLLGAAFMAGIVYFSVQIPYSGAYSSIIVAMNGFHALHVLVGIAIFAYIMLRAGQGTYTKERYWTVEAGVLFWHFVDLMWVFFFAVIFVL
jgi:heme/copper-type cytochrome/quinol oxidase subunit 3